MSVTYKLKRVVDRRVESYTAPKQTKICGVKIAFKPSRQHDSVSWDEWEDTFTTLLPMFKSVGWLKEFNRINVGDGLITNNAVAQYFMSHKSIDLENNVDMGEWSEYVVGDTREHTLVHEIIHHAHMYLNDFGQQDVSLPDADTKVTIQHEVSHYASSSINEAIAEIGSGIALGHEFPEFVHDFYEKYDGPQGVYEIGETLR